MDTSISIYFLRRFDQHTAFVCFWDELFFRSTMRKFGVFVWNRHSLSTPHPVLIVKTLDMFKYFALWDSIYPNWLIVFSYKKKSLHLYIFCSFPRYTPLQLFDGNTAHSMRSTGLLIDEMQRMDGTTELASYRPREGVHNRVSRRYLNLQTITISSKKPWVMSRRLASERVKSIKTFNCIDMFYFWRLASVTRLESVSLVSLFVFFFWMLGLVHKSVQISIYLKFCVKFGMLGCDSVRLFTILCSLIIDEFNKTSRFCLRI